MLIFILVGFAQISQAQENKKVEPSCVFEKQKFSKKCPKPEKLTCNFEYTKEAEWPYSHLERNLGACQCMITSSDFFMQHRELQISKNQLKKDSEEYKAINEKIKALCINGKTYEVKSNGRIYRGIYNWDENFEACRVDFFNAKNGWFDRDRFAFPGAYNGNGAFRTYPDDIITQFMKVKVDESLIDLNLNVGSKMSCAGTYEKIIDRKIRETGGMKEFKALVETERDKNPKEFYLNPPVLKKEAAKKPAEVQGE